MNKAAVRALPEKWRREWKDADSTQLPDLNAQRCADELEAALASLPGAGDACVRLDPQTIEAGWRDTFSAENPFCPCDLKTFTKAVRWAERATEDEEYWQKREERGE